MNNKGFNILVLILIILNVGLISGAGWLVYENHKQYIELKSLSKSKAVLQSKIQNMRNQKTLSKPSSSLTASLPKTITILYNNYGFDPNTVNVPVGTTVFVKNSATDGPMVFNELPHQSSPNPELNLGIIEMGQEKSFTLTIKGTWQFQNGNEASDRGILTAN